MAETNVGIPNDIRESVAIGNIKSVAEQPAMLSNLANANLVANTNIVTTECGFKPTSYESIRFNGYR